MTDPRWTQGIEWTINGIVITADDNKMIVSESFTGKVLAFAIADDGLIR